MAARQPIGRRMHVPKAGELIAEQLRSRIVRGDLALGDNLPSEGELMMLFGVSRPTLREAFRILEAEALITIRRGSRGARVTMPAVEVAARSIGALLQINGVTLADVYAARAVFEPAAVRLLAARATDADIDDLTECVQRLRSLISAAVGIETWAATTYEFHELLVERSGNKTLALQSNILREVAAMHLEVVTRRTFEMSPRLEIENFRRAVRSYDKVIALVRAHDAEAAAAHWAVHMEIASRTLLDPEFPDRMVIDLFT